MSWLSVQFCRFLTSLAPAQNSGSSLIEVRMGATPTFRLMRRLCATGCVSYMAEMCN